MAKSQSITEEVRQRVVPSLCREAVEAACAEIVRAKAVRRGQSAISVDDQLRGARNLRSLLALALLDDAAEHAALNAELQRFGPNVPSLIGALNAGAHGEYNGSALTMHERTPRSRHQTYAVGVNVVELLRAALALLDDPVEDTATVWPLGAAVLTRQAIEATIDAFWAKTVPAMQHATAREQWLALPSYLGRMHELRAAEYAWSALSDACHHREYDVGLTELELRAHLRAADAFRTAVGARLEVRAKT